MVYAVLIVYGILESPEMLQLADRLNSKRKACPDNLSSDHFKNTHRSPPAC